MSATTRRTILLNRDQPQDDIVHMTYPLNALSFKAASWPSRPQVSGHEREYGKLSEEIRAYACVGAPASG
jgi:hypothetical protein